MSVDRATAIQELRHLLNDELVVAALGNPAYDLFAAGDRAEHFYMWGAMGLAPSVGLGVAMATPSRRVIAMEGDGGMLMNLGALATIGALSPANMVLIVWDNGSFDLTGGQPTATNAGVDLGAVALGCGISSTHRIATLEEFRALTPRFLDEPGPWCIIVETAPTPPERRKPLVALRRRFVRIEEFTDAARTHDSATP